MGKKHLIITDVHAHPDHDNDRADWIGQLIVDVKPDVVIELGDAADMPSLCSYDKGKASFVGRTYQKDIEVHADFQDRMWSPAKRAKKRLPYRVAFIGNHEERIGRAIEYQPELNGTISYSDLDLDRWYDEVVHYEGSTPGSKDIDGVLYAHYFVSGVMGRPISGEHHAHSLLSKNLVSSTVGHDHRFDYSIRTTAKGTRIQGLCAGWGGDYYTPWAGDGQRFWVPGVAIKHEVHNGSYDLEWVSMARLKKAYSK